MYSSYNSEIIFDFVNSTCVKKTVLGSLLKAIGNSGQGKVVPGWGAVPVMAIIGLLLQCF